MRGETPSGDTTGLPGFDLDLFQGSGDAVGTPWRVIAADDGGDTFVTRCGCVGCGGGWPDGRHLLEAAAVVPEFAPSAFSLDQISVQLRTQWGGGLEGIFRSWGKNDLTFSVSDFIAGTGGEGRGFHNMSSALVARAAEAFTLWDDLIPLSFTETNAATSADITFNTSTSAGGGAYAYTFTTGTGTFRTIPKGEIWIDTTFSGGTTTAANLVE